MNEYTILLSDYCYIYVTISNYEIWGVFDKIDFGEVYNFEEVRELANNLEVIFDKLNTELYLENN